MAQVPPPPLLPLELAPDFLSVKEAAGYLRLCDKTVYKMVEAGSIPVVRGGTAGIRINKRALCELGAPAPERTTEVSRG